MQKHLALCCKAMLHVLSMGNVVVMLGNPNGGRPLLQLNRCLAKQPNGVLHLAIIKFREGVRHTPADGSQVRARMVLKMVLILLWACPVCQCPHRTAEHHLKFKP